MSEPSRHLSKSPLAVAREALRAAQACVPAYATPKSKHLFTQPQLLAMLVLRQFFATDYRGMQQLLRDLTDLRTVLGLKSVPHFTTLQKAERRLLKKTPCSALWTSSWAALRNSA